MQFFTPADLRQIVAFPMFNDLVPFGFPNTAQIYVERRINLNELMVQYLSATYFFKSSDSVVEAGIDESHLLVVGSSCKSEHGSIIIANVDGEFTIKRLQFHPIVILRPENPAYNPMLINSDDDLEVIAVATYIVKSGN